MYELLYLLGVDLLAVPCRNKSRLCRRHHLSFACVDMLDFVLCTRFGRILALEHFREKRHCGGGLRYGFADYW